MENIMNYVRPELLVLIPVLYFIGMGLKKTQTVADKYIPLLLALLWVLAGSQLTGAQDVLRAVFAAVTQGVLCAGCSVYAHQIGKQAGKEE